MMSTEARASPSGGRDSVESISPYPYPPQFYPGANYQGQPQPPWFPGQIPPGASGPWPAPWGYPGPPPGWSPTSPAGKTTSPHSSSVPAPSDEYTVDTMRRIYNDDDGRVEIQRVKVQRRPPEISTALFPPGTDAMSIVPAGTFPVNERRPPPRKNKLKKQMELMKSFPGQQGPYPPYGYPYNPCMPYQYPYPYYYGGGCMWPPGITAPPPMTPWAGSNDSERTTSRQESLATTIDSQRLESRVSAPSRNSHSPMSQRSPSPAATIHSIAPSDSVSMRGYKNENSLTVSLRGPTPPPRTKSRMTTERRMRAIMAPSDVISEAGDDSSIITTSTDIVPYQKLPPKRKKRKSRALSISDRSSSLDQKDTDSLSDRSSIASEMTNDDSLKLNSELSYAFRKFEQSVDVFKTKFSVESTPVNTPPRSPSPIIVHSNDIATSTKDDVRIPSSEDNAAGEETDTYISKSDMLDDQQLSTSSFISLPPLEPVPPESLASSTTSKKTEETPPSSGKTVACDSRLEESSQNLPATVAEVSASTPQLVSDVTSTTMVITDTATKATDVQQTLESTSVHESSTTPSIVTSTVVSSTPEIPEGTTVVPSEQVPGKESQSGAITKETNEKDSGLPSGKLEVSEMELDASSGRDSRLSSSTFFSIRPSDDPLHIDTDSTDILLPTTDATTADEGGEGTDWTASSPVVEDTESYQWVLQQPGETPDLACSTADREDERRNAWRAEVSLWRARLVVSLCRGRGLDRQDWATFHLLVHHPLTLDLKLSMLHAPRLCVANSTIGAALVRVALIHLAQHGETLLQPEASRQLGWRSIKVDPNQSWSPVKGAVEILKGLGYQEREDGVLRYPRRSATEVSVLARLTLDMLVLAEELRLYLTGSHQYPTNISDLFFPTAASTSASSEGPHIFQDVPRPPSPAESYGFMSAQSSISLNHRPDSRASSVTDEETETLQVSVKPAKSNSKKFKQPSSSEDEVTLKEDLLNKTSAVPGISTTSTELKAKVEDKANRDVHTPGLTEPLPMPSLLEQSNASLDMSSLPDLQSIRSSMASLLTPQMREFDRNGSVTPVPTPVPDTEETKDNPEEHIYEEIDSIRQQVQALRASSVPVDIQPPPLPPKKKMSSGGEDDSGLSLTYPHMEWTSTSMPGSLRGGSRGARKKKRRAPMPPEFMPPDWIPYENRPQETAKTLEQEKAESKAKYGSRRSLNPFYEDIDSVKAEVKELNKAYESRRKGRLIKGEKEANPFNKDDYVVSGYVGKNPFYEDIEEDEDLDNQKSVCHSAASLPKPGGSKFCAMGSLSELQDENAILKAKRRAPKPPSTPDPSSRAATPQPPKAPSSPQPPKSPSSPQPPKHPPSVPPPEPPSSPQPPKSPSSPQPPKSPSSPQPPKAPSSPSPKQPPTTPPPRPPVSQQENMKDVHKENTTGKEKTNLVEESSKESPNKLTKPVTAEVSGNIAQQQTSDIKNQETNQTPDETDESHADKTKARNVVSKAIKASQQKLQIQHPTIPPPPPPPKLGDDEEASPTIPADGPLDGTASQDKPQPPFDDIPYMDANELKVEVAKLAQSEVPQPQYEIPELPGKDGIPPAPPLSPTIMRQTALLLSGHRSVPFIDDSDLPPDCPPPPPPTSPPDSPSETPKASPPETPDASPPETPHVSPPATPHNSPTETPCGSSPSSPITVKEEVLEPSTESLPKVDDSDNLQSAAQSEKPTKEDSVNIIEDIQASTSATDNESSVRGIKSIATSSSSKVQQELASKDLDTANEPPPLPPKTLISHNSSNEPPPDPYANQSFKSSVSEEKYEIPEIPKPETSEETQNMLESIEEDRKDEIDYKHQSPSVEAEPEEERYEIPEVVKETALSIGPEGMPVRVGGPAHGNRMDLESVFGPPKPPRRRRNSSLPPPRPPKSMFLESSPILKLPPRAATTIRPASASTTSSFATASAGSPTLSRTTPTSLQGTPRPTLAKQKSKTRRSWPLLFCDCMYANCKNYDAIEK